jgi:hypothetical protein
MERFNGGTKVQGGYYIQVAKWEVVTVAEDVGTLPGGSKDQYLHAPLPVLMVVAPVMGAVFAVFLPFLGFAMPVWALGKKLADLGAKAAGEVAATLTTSWQPGVAHLADKPEEQKAGEAAEGKGPAGDEKLTELGKEIEQRRGDEKK